MAISPSTKRQGTKVVGAWDQRWYSEGESVHGDGEQPDPLRRQRAGSTGVFSWKEQPSRPFTFAECIELCPGEPISPDPSSNKPLLSRFVTKNRTGSLRCHRFIAGCSDAAPVSLPKGVQSFHADRRLEPRYESKLQTRASDVKSSQRNGATELAYFEQTISSFSKIGVCLTG